MKTITTKDLHLFEPCLKADAIYHIDNLKQMVQEGDNNIEIILNESKDETQPSIICYLNFTLGQRWNIKDVTSEIICAHLDADTEVDFSKKAQAELVQRINKLILKNI